MGKYRHHLSLRTHCLAQRGWFPGLCDVVALGRPIVKYEAILVNTVIRMCIKCYGNLESMTDSTREGNPGKLPRGGDI